MATMKRIPQRPSRPSTPAAGLLLRRKMQRDSVSSSCRHVHRATLGDCVSTSFAARDRQAATVTSPSYFLPEVTCKKHTSLTSTTTHSTGDSADKKTSTCDSEQSAINPTPSASCASSSSDPAVYTEEEMERRRNLEKCLTWVHSLPDKFSSMHIVQQTVFAASDS